MKITFLGDSITMGYGLTDPLNDRFSRLVCDRLGAEEDNQGITGTLIARAGLNRTDGKSYVDRIGLTDGAELAVVFGGTNDYFWSDQPILPPDDAADADERYFAVAVETLCCHICTHRAAEKTLIVTPYPHHGTGNRFGGSAWNDADAHDTDARNFNGHRLADYGAFLAAAGAVYGIPVLDLRNAGFDWRTMTLDGCHPNPAGHLWLAERVTDALKKIMA